MVLKCFPVLHIFFCLTSVGVLLLPTSASEVQPSEYEDGSNYSTIVTPSPQFHRSEAGQSPTIAPTRSPNQPRSQPLDAETLTQQYPQLDKFKERVIRFSDVPPSDWAYEPISSLMQKYGCISGYPDGTFRGQQALTRNEFAAGLESCMNRIDKLIQARTANLVTREDLATLFRILSTIFENTPPSPSKPQLQPSQPSNQSPAPGSPSNSTP